MPTMCKVVAKNMKIKGPQHSGKNCHTHAGARRDAIESVEIEQLHWPSQNATFLPETSPGEEKDR